LSAPTCGNVDGHRAQVGGSIDRFAGAGDGAVLTIAPLLKETPLKTRIPTFALIVPELEMFPKTYRPWIGNCRFG
jgi:hypothetical protein